MTAPGPMAILATADNALRDRLIETMAVNSILWVSCNSFDELEETASDNSLGCILLDARLGDSSRILEMLSRASSWMPVLLLCGERDLQTAVTAMKSGASDVAEVNSPAEALIVKIRGAFNADRAQKADSAVRQDIERHLSKLTDRELEIAHLLSSGMSNKQMAACLGISTHTVANHRGSINAKLEAQNTAEVIRMVIMHACPGTLRINGKAGGAIPPCLCSHAIQSKCA
jgi:two-component system response regulator FixJ